VRDRIWTRAEACRAVANAPWDNRPPRTPTYEEKDSDLARASRGRGGSVTITFEVIEKVTDAAVLFAIDNDEQVWIPKSQILSVCQDEGWAEITQWIAEQKDLGG